ncbi:MAG: MFS transporter [Promethearchaeota archaeon]
MNEIDSREFSAKGAVAYSFGQLSLITAYQSFTFLVFTFYYAVVKLDVVLITIGFIVWSIFNAFNDPIMGYFSDRTHTKWGRRRPYIMIALVPLAVAEFFLFFPPLSYGIKDAIINFAFFVSIILIFEMCYTTYDINLTSLLPELFITEEARLKANNIRQVFAIFGLIFAFILPSFFISDYSDPKSLNQYAEFGIVLMILIIIIGLIFLKFTPREREEFREDYKLTPGFVEGFKRSLKNKSFRRAIPAFMGDMFVTTMLPTIVPLYGKYVLNVGEGETFLLSLMLGITFISAAISITFIWRPIAAKIGIRRMWMISSFVWILTLVPLLFITDISAGFIVFFLIGIGLAGSLYSKDLIVAAIIDEDEVLTGSRNDASYFAFYIFFLRLATIFVFLAISLVFTNTGWAIYEPEAVTPRVIMGLRVLAFLFPAIALTIIILAMVKYPLDGDYLKDIREKLEKIHEEKRAKVKGLKE